MAEAAAAAYPGPMTWAPPRELEIIVAHSAGTCFGVEDAIAMAREQRQPILGPIVHNPIVVGELAPNGALVLIDATGNELWPTYNPRQPTVGAPRR